MIARLRDLITECRAVYCDDPVFPLDTWRLSFTCPKCGPPFIVTVHIGPSRLETPRRWQWNHVPETEGFTDRLTLLPSINNVGVGHGPRHPSCSFHANIVNGNIVPA